MTRLVGVLVAVRADLTLGLARDKLQVRQSKASDKTTRQSVRLDWRLSHKDHAGLVSRVVFSLDDNLIFPRWPEQGGLNAVLAPADAARADGDAQDQDVFLVGRVPAGVTGAGGRAGALMAGALGETARAPWKQLLAAAGSTSLSEGNSKPSQTSGCARGLRGYNIRRESTPPTMKQVQSECVGCRKWRWPSQLDTAHVCRFCRRKQQRRAQRMKKSREATRECDLDAEYLRLVRSF